MADFPLMSGTPYSWASTTITILWTGGSYSTPLIKGAKHSAKIEREKMRGAGTEALGATQGERDYEGSLTMYKDGWKRLRSLMALSIEAIAAGGKIGAVKFDILIVQREGLEITRVEMQKCQIAGSETSYERGNAPTEVEIPLLVMRVLEDGIAI